MTTQLARTVGPILMLDAIDGGRMWLSALFIVPGTTAPPPVEVAGADVPLHLLAHHDAATVWRARFDLPADRPSEYLWNGETFEVAGDMTGDLRIAYVSCNGEEVGDLHRDGDERNALWGRLGAAHRDRPFALLLHGGDQVYADEITDGHPLTDDWPDRVPKDPDPGALDSLRHHLRERLFQRYVALYQPPEVAWLVARVPSLMQWDDHDICDGWGSLKDSRTHSAVGQVLFSVARDGFLLFQHATVAGDLPARFADPGGAHLGWRVDLPGLRLVAPDLRSERGRRAIMGAGGWAMMDAEAEAPANGRTVILSSVPILGPRMSLLESLMVVIPRMQKYEDDLRDQWQSRAHRAEWRRILRLLGRIAARDGQNVTVLSGEIHLATRAAMTLGQGRSLHQLVASGISHRAPPRAWARFLGALASLGDSPIPGQPIRILRLPGQRTRYVADRNYLTLERTAGAWSARWELERTGTTPPLAL